MDANAIHARRSLETYGDKAELEAARKAAECEKQRDGEQAKDWRRIKAAISQMRSPLAAERG